MDDGGGGFAQVAIGTVGLQDGADLYGGANGGDGMGASDEFIIGGSGVETDNHCTKATDGTDKTNSTVIEGEREVHASASDICNGTVEMAVGDSSQDVQYVLNDKHIKAIEPKTWKGASAIDQPNPSMTTCDTHQQSDNYLASAKLHSSHTPFTQSTQTTHQCNQCFGTHL